MRNGRAYHAIFFIPVLFIAIPVRADEARLRLYGAVDLFGSGGAEDAIENDINGVIDALASAGIPSSAEIETTGGVGFRAGALVPTASPHFAWGGSLGAVFGPAAEVRFIDLEPGNPGTVDADIGTAYLRALFELTVRAPLNERIGVKLTGGAGLAYGKTVQEFRGTGAYAGSTDAEESAFGPTFEISPAFVFDMGRVDVELGGRYAVFPTIDETDATYEIEWRPFGLYGALLF